MGIHLPNDFMEDGKNTPEQAEEERNQVYSLYEKMDLQQPHSTMSIPCPNGELTALLRIHFCLRLNWRLCAKRQGEPIRFHL
jgi:hypothetical protein